jgi:hypothetical protein
MENSIETKTSEELGLLLQQQYETLFVTQQNIKMLSKELGDRLERHKAVGKEVDETKQTT